MTYVRCVIHDLSVRGGQGTSTAADTIISAAVAEAFKHIVNRYGNKLNFNLLTFCTT